MNTAKTISLCRKLQLSVNINKSFSPHLLLFHLQISKKSFYCFVSVFSLCLLAYNSAGIFSTHLPISAEISPETTTFSPEIVAGKSRKFFSLPSPAETSPPFPHSAKDDETPGADPHQNRLSVEAPNRTRQEQKRFQDRVAEFFNGGGGNSCRMRFFMTWIKPSADSFGDREMFAVSSLFRSHPIGCCLIIASNSLDSSNGDRILKPLLKKGFQVTAISPDFNYLFKGTPAREWYNQLMRGNVNPGEVSLGQNLSNLLRLGLLYRFGGIYLDTDVIVLRNLNGLRNAIGAQTIDHETKNWSRLNNAVMIFDEGHPLLYKFIREFAATFDGNKWGHNGPYLVSRVVARAYGMPGHSVAVLPPAAFYPVNWSRIGSLFEGPKNSSHSKWLLEKLRQIRSRSFGVHLWNKQSRGFEVEKGSIVEHIMLGS
ncbi:hypothetical protein OROGR_007087 [Orobanche gracilis]